MHHRPVLYVNRPPSPLDKWRLLSAINFERIKRDGLVSNLASHPVLTLTNNTGRQALSASPFQPQPCQTFESEQPKPLKH
jgi:hypothetical protein